MKPKNLVILGSILVLIVAISIVWEKLSNRKPSTKSLQFFPGLTTDNISAFLIADSKDTVEIRRKSQGWMVILKRETQTTASTGAKPFDGGASSADTISRPVETVSWANPAEYPADSSSVASVIDKLVSMKKGELISSKPEKQSIFEVDSLKGTLVKVWDGRNEVLGSFYIGKSGADWSSNFVRFTNSPNVFNVTGSIKYAFFTDKNRWKDKTIIKFSQAQAKKITLIKQGGNIYELEKATDTTGATIWNLIQPEKLVAKKEEVDKVLSTLSSFTTSDWETNPSLSSSDMGFDKPELIATVTLENGTVKAVTIGKKKEGDNKFWVKTEGKDVVFLVSEYNIEKLDRKLNDFKGLPADETNTTQKQKSDTKKEKNKGKK